jgi:hypothetical protein
MFQSMLDFQRIMSEAITLQKFWEQFQAKPSDLNGYHGVKLNGWPDIVCGAHCGLLEPSDYRSQNRLVDAKVYDPFRDNRFFTFPAKGVHQALQKQEDTLDALLKDLNHCGTLQWHKGQILWGQAIIEC